ncbi:MAG: hypothetical protein M1827_003834 [Pycnora praestabilis]|nr:MAG: hypothetical protein M1827_003834 [Pycnora praestabilis]
MVVTMLTSTVYGHSWDEQMMVIAPNGTFVGQPGYARGNVLRTAPGFNDNLMVNLIPPNGRANQSQILPTDLMCKDTQQSQNQTAGSPRLQAAAGNFVAIRYQENGHVTLPQNQPGKPANRGTVYIYGTEDSQPTDTLLAIHNVWNANGTGGDGRGKLLAMQPFDDGKCYQVNGGNISVARQQEFPHTASQLMGANLWCQNDIQIPQDAPSGKPYSVYWVWDWPTAPGTPGLPDGKEEIYTSCADIDIGTSQTSSEVVKYTEGQDLDNAAIESYLTSTPPASGSPQTSQPGATSTAVTPSSPSQSEQAVQTTGTPAAADSASPAPSPASAQSQYVTTVTIVENVTKTTTTTLQTAIIPATSPSIEGASATAAAAASSASMTPGCFNTPKVKRSAKFRRV